MVEIKRDFDYLARLWDEVRERTLGSSAPALIYRDSDLVKRAIRDLYHREIDEVIVEGDEGYKAARGFMKLLMPSHVKRVIAYRDPTPVFQRYGVEDQLSAMYQPVVQLKSGGYLVINPTEALVSIDINSGRSTREHNIEQTATATNLEAAAEIARQLRLRDMAGLVVIDFIDMEQSGHVRKVEKAMKDALKNDRARIQVGRISSFGLMEMSRQRLRTGVLEASTRPCAHCEGTGLMRTASSSGLSALRIIEDEAARGRGNRILLRAGREAAIYVLNRKRAELAEIEERYGVTVEIVIDESFEGARMSVESSGDRPDLQRRLVSAPIVAEDDDEDDAFEDDEEEEEVEAEERAEREPRGEGRDEESGDRDARRGRRRRRRGGRNRNRRDEEGGTERPESDRGERVESDAESEGDGDEQPREAAPRGEDGEGRERSSSRRGRRGGRGRRGRVGGDRPRDEEAAADATDSPMIETPVSEEQPQGSDVAIDSADDTPKARRRPRARKTATVEPPVAVEAKPEAVVEADAKPKRRSRAKAAPEPIAELEVVEAPEATAKPARAPRARKPAASAAASSRAAKADDGEVAVAMATETDDDDGEGGTRRGWWNRTFG